MHKDSVVEISTHLFLIRLCRWRTITKEDYDHDYEDIENTEVPVK